MGLDIDEDDINELIQELLKTDNGEAKGAADAAARYGFAGIMWRGEDFLYKWDNRNAGNVGEAFRL